MRMSIICLFAAVLCCGCTDAEQADRTSKAMREAYEAQHQAAKEAREAGLSEEEATEAGVQAASEILEAAKQESE